MESQAYRIPSHPPRSTFSLDFEQHLNDKRKNKKTKNKSQVIVNVKITLLTIVHNYTASLNFVNFLYVLKSLLYAGIGLRINSCIGANTFNGLEYFTVLEG